MACFETILDYDERVVGRDEETARLLELRELLSTSVLVLSKLRGDIPSRDPEQTSCDESLFSRG